jgi:hypothetical protein
MMADRGLVQVVAGIGFSVLLAGGAVAQPSWQNYAPRCQTQELAGQPAMIDPCEEQLAMFGLSGPQVLSPNHSFDVETTGSINGDRPRNTGENGREPL